MVSDYTLPEGTYRTCPASTARGVARQASQKVSRYRGVEQLYLRVSRYTVQLCIELDVRAKAKKVHISHVLP